jgi:molybdopterin molybdotransferase
MKTEDVRMKGFGARASVAEVLSLIAQRVQPLPSERIPFSRALGRSLAETIIPTADVPAFDKSAMDGYAVRAADLPGRLTVVGELMAKDQASASLAPQSAVRVMTGAAIVPGADAVVMVEDTRTEGSLVIIDKAVSPGTHVLRRGEDLGAGRPILRPPRRLRPQDLAMLATVSALEPAVRRRPRVRIVPTGNELVPIGTTARGSEIVESNSFMLRAMAERDGAEVEIHPIVADDAARLRRVLEAPGADLVVVTGGSSVGKQDLGPVVVREAGQLLIHGIHVKPASPTGFGFVGETAVLLAPGFPVASFVAWDLFGREIVERMLGLPPALPYPTRTAKLGKALEKPEGRTDLVRVTLRSDSEGAAVLTPIPGGAALLSTTTAADGFVLLPAGRARFEAGEVLLVHLY